MPKNNDIFQALSDSAGLATKTEADRNKALEDLLAAPPDDPVKFRKAIEDNQAFWSTYPGLMTIPTVGTWTSTLTLGVLGTPQPVAGYYQSDQFLDASGVPNFQAIHQLAAEQRVKFGLQKANEDVLIAILKNNPDECRVYLATRPELGNLKAAPGWKENEMFAPHPPLLPVEINTSTDVISDQAIDNIKKQARDLLLIKLIEKTSDRALLENIAAAPDKLTLETAANAISYPTEGNAALIRPLSTEVQTVLDQKILALKQAAAKTSFESYVNTMSLDTLLDQDELLESLNFKNDLPAPHKTNLADTDVDWAKGILGARYIQAALAQESQDVLPALKTLDATALKVELKKLLGNHDYIDHAVTDTSLGPIKKAMMHSFINNAVKDPAQLKALDNAKTFDKFKEQLTAMGVTPLDWLKQEDLKDIKQWARSRHLDLAVANLSQLGVGTHPELLKTFNQLPMEQQRRVLEKPENLRFVLHAKEPHVIEHYLGKNAPGITEILAENKRLTSFHLIHNSEVARVLANFKPQITLDNNQVAAINQALATASSNPNTFTDPAQYKILIDAIKTQCVGVNSNKFDKAFDLDATGAFRATTTIRDEISKQQGFNKNLLIEYNNPANAANKKLLDVFLCIQKSAILQVGAPSTPTTTPMTTAFLSAFNQSETAQVFINKFSANPSVKARLEMEFSPELFHQLKSEARKAQFVTVGDPAKVNKAITDITKKLSDLQEMRIPATKSAEGFKFIAEVNPVHLYNPSFQGTAKLKAAAMKSKYGEMASDSDLVVDQLRRNINTLQGYLKSVPKDSELDPALPKEEKAKISKLRSDLEKELEATRKDLAFYERVQNNLHSILKAVEDAAQGKKAYHFESDRIKRTVVSRDAIPPLPTNPVAPVTPSAIRGGAAGQIKNFLLDEKIPEGSVAVYDVSHTSTMTGTPVESIGRFTVDTSGPPQISSKGGELSSIPSVSVEVDEFPRQIPPPPRGTADDGRLIEAKVNFSMAAAAEALANLDQPPTKDKPLILVGSDPEELEYLWTALVVLGEKGGKMSFDPDAIKVESAAFQPSAKKGRLWGYNHDANSLYTSVFKNKEYAPVQNVVQQKADRVSDLAAEKTGHQKAVQDFEGSVAKMTQSKDQLHAIKSKAPETIEREGPASKPKGP